MSELFAAGEASALLDATIRGELPDERGRFGPFGGRYVPETLVPAFERLEDGVREHLHDPSFQDAFQNQGHSLTQCVKQVARRWLREFAGQDLRSQ